MKLPYIVNRTQTIRALQTAMALKHQYLFYFMTGMTTRIVHQKKNRATWTKKTNP